MKSISKQTSRKKAFTIIELLTVMSIIVILIGVLVPALNNVRRYAKKVKQKAQFNAIQAAIELFNNENDGYPPSGALDGVSQPYCGAMKLCEAMMGRDLLGFHPDSVFRADGLDATSTRPVYLPTPENAKARLGPLLQFENANAYRLGTDIYGPGNTGSFAENPDVLTGTEENLSRLYSSLSSRSLLFSGLFTPDRFFSVPRFSGLFFPVSLRFLKL